MKNMALKKLLENKANFFLVNAGLTFGAFLIILLILPWLRRVYYETIGEGKKG